MEEGEVLVPQPPSPVTRRKPSGKFVGKKVPVKSAIATNLNQRLQMHHPRQNAQVFLNAQKVI